MKDRTSRTAGFTLVEIMIVVAIIGLLAAIAIPNFVRARTQSQKNACINNMRKIDDAIQTWATEHNIAIHADVEFTDIQPYLKNEVICPAGGTTFADSYNICHSDHDTLGKGTRDVRCLISPSDHILTVDTTK